MKTKLLVTILSIIVVMSLVGSVHGSTVTSATVGIHPAKGDITTEIFLNVRGTPYNGTSYNYYEDFPVLYVYYDNKLIVDKMEPFKVPYTYGAWTDYLLNYDVKIKVPDEFPYSELGSHTITVVIEALDGTFASAFVSFEVVNYIPPPDWWEKLPQEFIDEITGATGATGAQGEQGIQGGTGKQGIQGETGEQGVQGEIGEQGIGEKGDTGEQGIQGVQGEQGEQGPIGPQGKTGDTALGYALLALAAAIIAMLIALTSYTKKR